MCLITAPGPPLSLQFFIFRLSCQSISQILATETGCSPLQRSALSGVGERYTEPLTRGHIWAATSHSECVSCGQAGQLGQPLVPRNEMLHNQQPGLASVCTSSADVSLAQVTDGWTRLSRAGWPCPSTCAPSSRLSNHRFPPLCWNLLGVIGKLCSRSRPLASSGDSWLGWRVLGGL